MVDDVYVQLFGDFKYAIGHMIGEGLNFVQQNLKDKVHIFFDLAC